MYLKKNIKIIHVLASKNKIFQVNKNSILSHEQKFALANFGKNFGKSTSSNVAKVIKTLSEIVD